MGLSFYCHFAFFGGKVKMQWRGTVSYTSLITADWGLWATTGSEEKSSNISLIICSATAFFNARIEYSPTPSKTTAHSTN